ncbi:MAG: amidohydrolase [Clostridia bacterium]|nr:amidohydrolase [Clostridia bacterium]
MKKENLEKAIKLRHELHEHPELSNQEIWTKNHLIEFLRDNTGLEIVDRGRWFYAVYRSETGNRNIAFRADFDAIAMEEPDTLEYSSKNPGAAHKCGHDGHSATLAAFAMEIDQDGSDNNIFFLFQHAEETGDGAKEAYVFIEENNIEEIFAYHNMSSMAHGSVNVKDGAINCASSGMTIRMQGQPSHASEPEKGRNPAFAIAKVIDAIPELISTERNSGMVLCTVIQVDVGERAFGVSPGSGSLLLTIRALYGAEMDRLRENLEKISREEAERHGLSVSFEYNDVFPETSNHKESADKIRKVSLEKGMKLVEMSEAFRGSEDFGEYLKHTKGAICYIGNGEDYAPVHTFDYDFRDDIIETAVELFKGLSEL